MSGCSNYTFPFREKLLIPNGSPCHYLPSVLGLNISAQYARKFVVFLLCDRRS